MENIALTAAVRQVLSVHGPTELSVLARLVEERGIGPDAGSIEDVLVSDGSGVAQLPDGRWVDLLTLLAGRTFTHGVSADEVGHDLLHVAPDLVAAVLLDVPAYEEFVDGTLVDPIYPESDEAADLYPDGVVAEMGSVPLDDGTLRGLGVADGDLVGLRFTPAGVELTRVEEVAAEATDRRLAVGVLEAQPDRPMTLDLFVLAVLAADDQAFRAAGPPLAELLASWDVATDGEFVAVPGFDLDGWWAERRLGSLGERYDLSADEALAVAGLLHLHEQLREQADPGDLGLASSTLEACAAFLEEPAVADALLEETTVLVDPSGAAALGMLAESLLSWVPRGPRPALHWLQGKAYEQLGAMAEAEQSFRTCLRLDPEWSPALVDLARMAGDRGEVAAGLALLERAGPDSAPQLQELLEQHRAAPGPALARNAPCWCGSGRKFKQCHLRHPDELPLSERADWLYRKAGLHLLQPQWIPMLTSVAVSRARYADSEEKVRQAALDPLLPDVLLFEGGALDDFVRLRGSLLPADELLLAQRWLLTERSVYEVTDVEPGRSMTLRDLATGEVSVVVERTASRELEPGRLICTHVLPLGEQDVLFGGIEPVTLPDRDALLELLDDGATPGELVAFFTRRFAPVALSNTELAPMVLEPVSDERTPVRGTRELAERPEVQEAITAYMADYEARWLDLPVPALGDRTPREVAADPTRREDLVALLASFPQTDDPTQMSAGRLRAALGLDQV